MKKNLSDMVKGAKDLKDQATKIGKEAIKTAGAAKGAAQLGFDVSKSALGKASKLINKEKIAHTLEATSKGLGMASKGMDIASKVVKDASDKFKSK